MKKKVQVFVYNDELYIECTIPECDICANDKNILNVPVSRCKKYNVEVFNSMNTLHQSKKTSSVPVLKKRRTMEEKKDEIEPENIVPDERVKEKKKSEKKSKKVIVEKEESDQDEEVKEVEMITIGKVELKNIVHHYCSKKLKPLYQRIEDLEQITSGIKSNKPKATRANASSKGCCHGCGLNSKTDESGKNVRLSPGIVPYNINRQPLATTKSSIKTTDPRAMPFEDFYKKYVLCHKYCTSCSSKWQDVVKFDLNNTNNTCINCRTMRSVNATQFCNACDMNTLQRDHANYKTPMHRAFKVLETTVMNVQKVTTSYEMDSSGFGSGVAEFNVGDYGSIDFVIVIDTEGGSKLLFCIEIMATKVEDLVKHAHKYAQAREIIKPDKSFVVTFDIQNDGDDIMSLGKKIDIFRRWVIFAIRYIDHLPKFNNWWLFPKRNAYPMQERHLQNMEFFWRRPVVIEKAPKEGFNGGSDWEFSVDVFTKSKSKSNSFKYINDETVVDVNEFMFGSSFPRYSLFNATSEAMTRCNAEDCEICKARYK
jgi:hypothetical protein